jgi:hypothetical protein
MAVQAFDGSMSPFQGVSRLFFVVEVFPLERFIGMTFIALRAEPAFVVVVFFVAIVTDRAGVFENLGLVAVATFDGLVFSPYREIGLLVIESGGLFPGLRVMAGVAGRPQFFFVNILLFVTGNTL